MYSTFCHYEYNIEVLVPNTEIPDGGFPVLFVLDGQRYSRMIYHAMENQMRNSMKTNVNATIIVSIGHQLENFSERRFFDFTPPATTYEFPLRRGKRMKEVPVGNGEHFKQFIEQELFPYIIRNYPVNEEAFSLFGHSLGGLFSLYIYLQFPHLFKNYIAVSPSVWWNNHQILQMISDKKLEDAPPLSIYVGGDEGDMVDDAMTFQKNVYLQKQVVEFYIALSENHASVIPTTISRALRFISSN